MGGYRFLFSVRATPVFLVRHWCRPSYRKMPEGVSLSAAWQVGPIVGMVFKGGE